MSTSIEIVHGGVAPTNGLYRSGFVYTDEPAKSSELFIYHNRNERAVSVFNAAEVINAAEEDSCRSGTTVFWSGTMREYLMNYSGLTPEQDWTESDHEECDWIRAIADDYGWDSTLFRADALYGEEYSTTPCTHLEAAIAYLEHDGERVRTARWMTDEELDEYFREDDEDDA